MKNLTLLVGIPGVGKSTWRARNVDENSLVCSTDDLIERAADQLESTYDAVFSDVIDEATKIFDEMVVSGLKSGVDIVIDRTNLSTKSRSKFLALAKLYGYDTHAVNFASPQTQAAHDEWNRRLANRPGKTIPDHVLREMFCSYKPATFEEGYTTICDIDSFGE